MRGVILVTAAICSVFIAAGRHFFGLGGALAVWYSCALAIPYFLLALLLAYRLTVLRRVGRQATRGVWLLWVLSTVCALAFALTVPDVQADGALAAIVAPPGADKVALEMSIALCNPFAILAFVFMGGSAGFAWAASRPAPPEPDED